MGRPYDRTQKLCGSFLLDVCLDDSGKYQKPSDTAFVKFFLEARIILTAFQEYDPRPAAVRLRRWRWSWGLCMRDESSATCRFALYEGHRGHQGI
jgi:hypothetical protein